MKILTGPNASGKSVYLKQVAACMYAYNNMYIYGHTAYTHAYNTQTFIPEYTSLYPLMLSWWINISSYSDFIIALSRLA